MSLFEKRAEERKKADRELMEKAYSALAASVGHNRGNWEFQTEPEEQKRDSAVTDCLEFLKVQPGSVPEGVEEADERVDWLCRPSGTMYRPVQLKGRWYRKTFGAMAGRLQSGESVALLPRGISGYCYRDPETGKRVRVNRKNAGQIDPQALLFYKPLPGGPVGKEELIRFTAGIFSRTDFVWLLLMTLAATLVSLLPAAANHFAFSTVIPAGEADLIIPVALFLLGTAISGAIITASRSLFMARVEQRMTIVSQAAFFSRLLNLPTAFFRNYSPGSLANRVECVTLLLKTGLSVLLGAGLSVLFALIFVFQIGVYAPALAFPALVIVLVQLTVLLFVMRMAARWRQASVSASNELSGTVTSLLSGVQKLKLAGAEDRAFAKWANRYAGYAHYTYNVPVWIMAGPVYVTLIGMAGMVWLYYCAGSAEVSVSNFMAFSAAYGQISAAVAAFTAASDQLISLRPLYRLIRPVLDEVPETRSDKPGVESISGSIEFSGVTFRYGEDSPYLFENLSFRVEAGEYVAIVGRSGCGKSTLMRLMLGMEKPERGSVFYDSYDAGMVDIRSLRRHIGVVVQDGKLFAGDILNNITLATPGATLDDAWEAAEIAGIAEDIRNMPMGMNTLISETGGISGGQKQRLLIARAVCRKRRILMLDEATSALDNRTQKHVADSLAKLDCTRIVIAHRLSTVKDCDRILVLENGKIAEQGTYDELIAKGGLFRELVRRQQLDGE